MPIQFTEVEIEIGGVATRVQADRGGIVDTVVPVSLAPGWHTAVLRAEGTEPAKAAIFVISPDTKLGIVSDIDDTVMVTALPRPFLALWNTFVLNERARMATPGMAVLMDRLMVEHPEAPVIYLSTGPWNAAPTLARFLTRNMYPAGALLLTDWGLTQDRWFRSGQEHKRRNLELLAEEFPNMRWLLFGDNGQHDEEIYSEFAQRTRTAWPRSASGSSPPAKPCWPAGTRKPATTPPPPCSGFTPPTAPASPRGSRTCRSSSSTSRAGGASRPPGRGVRRRGSPGDGAPACRAESSSWSQ